MFKFRGFRASLNFSAFNKGQDDENYPTTPENVSITGAYRINREEFYGYNSMSSPPKKITPSMVTLPPSQSKAGSTIKPAKSANNLDIEIRNKPATNIPSNLRKSTPDVSSDPRGGSTNDRTSTDLRKSQSKTGRDDAKRAEKKQKQMEKQQQLEQKKREKIARENEAKEAKLKKEKEKLEKKEKEKEEKKAKKTKTPKPPPQPVQKNNPLAQNRNYATNTLDSSISKNSGPPAYADVPDKLDVVPNDGDDTGNTSFGRPVDKSDDSWDLVTQHRKLVSRPVAASARTKQMVMDLQYNFNNNPQSSAEKSGNSEA